MTDEDFDLVVFACLPVDSGLAEPRPLLIDDTLSQCRNAECRRDIWITDQQRALLKELGPTGALVLCYPCSQLLTEPGSGIFGRT